MIRVRVVDEETGEEREFRAPIVVIATRDAEDVNVVAAGLAESSMVSGPLLLDAHRLVLQLSAGALH